MSNPYQPEPEPGPGAQPPPPEPAQQPKPKRSVSTGQILGGILLVVVVVFVLENTRKAKVRLLVPEVTMPLAVPIVIAAVLGALVAGLLRYRRRRNHPTR